MKVLGIDPGTNITGYAIIKKENNNYKYIISGIINLKKFKNIQEKLSELYSCVNNIIKKYQPDVIALEDIFYSKNIKSTMKLAYAKGAVFLAASHNNIKVFEYSATNIKSVASGYGRAAKDSLGEILKHIIEKLPEEFSYKDESDAIALAYCHLTTDCFNMRIL